MDTLQCAIVLAKLERFEWEVEQRLRLGQQYNSLMDAAGIARVKQRPGRTSVFAQYTIFTNGRAELQKQLSDVGIVTAVHYPVPLNEQPAYKHLSRPDSTPVAQQSAKQVMSLPMSADLSNADQQIVCSAIQTGVHGA